MPIIDNNKLYSKIKKEADKIYLKPSAYKSGWIVKTYKQRGGTYSDDNKTKNLERWFKEEWGDIGGKEYPVYRPFKRISDKTPLTVYEIDPINKLEQIYLKQIIKGTANLPPFIKGEGLLKIDNIPKKNEIWEWSNPLEVRKMANYYLGKDYPVYLSTRKDKKYMVITPDNKRVHFGTMKPPMEDYTKHKNLIRRDLFRLRNKKWSEQEVFTPGYLSYYLLW